VQTELAAIRERLADVYRPDGVEIWLHARNRGLPGHARPMDFIKAGDYQPVLDAIDRLRAGVLD
jgi:hypothetical protein